MRRLTRMVVVYSLPARIILILDCLSLDLGVLIISIAIFKRVSLGDKGRIYGWHGEPDTNILAWQWPNSNPTENIYN
jgi:hypothetical protein